VSAVEQCVAHRSSFAVPAPIAGSGNETNARPKIDKQAGGAASLATTS
jgi:hypothetical protein